MFTHDLELDAGELRRRIDLPMAMMIPDSERSSFKRYGSGSLVFTGSAMAWASSPPALATEAVNASRWE
jgi:hypothetical protein